MQNDLTDEIIQDDQPAQAASRPAHQRGSTRTDAQRAKARPSDRAPKTQNVAATHEADDELWDREETCAYFGGGVAKPINVSTLYRGIAKKIYPEPINVSLNVVRWIPRECREARQKLIAQRGKTPKPKRGRPRKTGTGT